MRVSRSSKKDAESKLHTERREDAEEKRGRNAENCVEGEEIEVLWSRLTGPYM